jgi:hypothetical protein
VVERGEMAVDLLGGRVALRDQRVAACMVLAISSAPMADSAIGW